MILGLLKQVRVYCWLSPLRVDTKNMRCFRWSGLSFKACSSQTILPCTFVTSNIHVTHNFNAKRSRRTLHLLADASVCADIRVTDVQSEKLFDLNLILTKCFVRCLFLKLWRIKIFLARPTAMYVCLL